MGVGAPFVETFAPTMAAPVQYASAAPVQYAAAPQVQYAAAAPVQYAEAAPVSYAQAAPVQYASAAPMNYGSYGATLAPTTVAAPAMYGAAPTVMGGFGAPA